MEQRSGALLDVMLRPSWSTHDDRLGDRITGRKILANYETPYPFTLGADSADASFGPAQRRHTFTGRLARPAPDLRITGGLGAIQGQIVDIVLTRIRRKAAGLQ